MRKEMHQGISEKKGDTSNDEIFEYGEYVWKGDIIPRCIERHGIERNPGNPDCQRGSLNTIEGDEHEIERDIDGEDNGETHGS